MVHDIRSKDQHMFPISFCRAFLREGLKHVPSSGSYSDTASFLQIGEGKGFAYAAGASGYHRDLVAQLKIHDASPCVDSLSENH
jgi:hypothetical protein